LVSETVIEETIEEGEAEPIMLSTSFSTGYGKSYEYDVSDL
jgi:hypothetical protein